MPNMRSSKRARVRSVSGMVLLAHRGVDAVRRHQDVPGSGGPVCEVGRDPPVGPRLVALQLLAEQHRVLDPG
jgi:hypothetical protein